MIKNKQQSKEFIVKHNLNTIITSQLFNTTFDLFNILKFLAATNQITHYGIRENKPSGLFSYAIERENILKVLQEQYMYKKFYICESMYFKDKENMLVQGDFYLTDDFILSYGYSDVKGKSLRDSSKNFPYKIWELDIKQRHYLNSNINKIIDYLVDNNLFNMMVELTLYNCKVGIKNENVIIWEVRNY